MFPIMRVEQALDWQELADHRCHRFAGSKKYSVGAFEDSDEVEAGDTFAKD